jgi:hypothetical protein
VTEAKGSGLSSGLDNMNVDSWERPADDLRMSSAGHEEDNRMAVE